MIYSDSEFLNSIAFFFYNHLPDVLNLNLTASIVILFVICVRQFLKRAPKIFSYALWGIVLLRLLVPVSIESPMSFVPERTEFTSMVDVNEALPEIEFQTAEDRLDNKRQMEISPTGDPVVLSHSIVEPQHYLTMIWIAGMLFLSVRSLLAYLGLRERVKVSVLYQKGIYIADDIDTPFVMGFFQPKIYLPGTLDQTEQKYIIAHERHHIRRGDHIFKALGFLALTIHWFNPFVWAAFILSGRDMEMSCDEAVIRKLGEDVRAEYSASLLNLATGKRMFAGTPLAFDEGDPTERVRNLARWKKPAIWIILICLIACIILAACLLTDPVTKLPFMDDYHKVTYAELIDLRENETIKRTYNNAERDELSYRLRDLKKIKAYTEENSIIPIYILKMDIENLGIVSIDCVSWNEDRALIHFNGNIYWIRDDEFIAYLQSASDSQFSAMASEEPPSDAEWGVSLQPDRVSRTGATALFVYSGSIPGEEGAELYYGDLLTLESVDENGNWVVVEELPGYEYYVGDSSYPVVDGYGMVHEWQDRFGELPDGHYRMGKSVALVRPDGSTKSQMVYGEFVLPDSVLTGLIPLEDLPEKYGAEQAEIDGCVVIRDGDVSRNQEVWQAFLDNVNAGQEAYVRTAEYYYDPERVQTTHFIYDIRFDGSRYSVEGILNGEKFRKEYQYLLTFMGEASKESHSYDSYIRYVLSNDLYERWEEANGITMDGSIKSERLPQVVYTDLIYETKRPDLPDKPDYASLEFQDSSLVTILDRERLEKLIWLFESAEYLGYEPKTHSIGVGLNLTLTYANEEFIIELDPDSDLCRINGEYVFYGAYDEPEYTYKLWEYLGITQWPDIVYMVCENALRP